MSTRLRWQATDALLFLTLLVLSIAASSPLKAQDIPPGALTAGGPTNSERKPLTEADVIKLLKDDVPPSRVGETARERKIDFQITAETERKIRLAGGDGDLVRILRQVAAKGVGFLFVGSDPPGAQVTLDGDPIGVTPLTQENVKSGPHRLVVSRPSFHSRVLNVVVEPNVVTRSSVEFDQLLAVSVETDFDFGTLSVDNQPVGPVKPTQRLSLLAGVHTFRLQDSRMSVDIIQQVDIGESNQKVLFLKADYLGNLTILSGIGIENLVVNGRSVESPSVTVPDIPAGSATVYGVSGPVNHVSQTVNITAGETAIMRIEVSDLKPNPPTGNVASTPTVPPAVKPPAPNVATASAPPVVPASPKPVVRVGAQEKAAGIVEFTGYSGFAIDDGVGSGTAALHELAGGSVAVSMNRWLWLYGDSAYSPKGTQSQTFSGSTQRTSEWLVPFHVGARIEFLESSRFSPYINFGGGIVHSHVSTTYSNVTPPGPQNFSYGLTEASFRGGIGARIRLTPRWGIRTSMEIMEYRFTNGPVGIFSAGIYFQTRPMPPPGPSVK
jgi:hypothetical protein